MAQILTLEQKDLIQPGFISGIFGSRPQQVTRKRINWEGLVLHGALMKG
jgi:hypothetical protein